MKKLLICISIFIFLISCGTDTSGNNNNNEEKPCGQPVAEDGSEPAPLPVC